MKNKKPAAWLSLVLCVAAALLANSKATAQEKAEPPRPGSREYAVQFGSELLAAEKWAEAAHALTIWPHDLKQAVQGAWDRVGDREPKEQDRYRYRLVHFFFDHMDFTWEGWPASATVIQDLGTKYQAIVEQTPPPRGEPVLDFSHLDLLGKVATSRASNGQVQVDRSAMVAAMKANPESIPAQAAYLLYLDTLTGPEKWTEVSLAVQVLTSKRGKLNLARTVARGGNRHDLVQPLLAAAWPLAASSQEKARLLYCLAEGQAGQKDDLPRARATATQVYEFFPQTHYAAEARALAASLLCQQDEPARAVAMIRDLRRRGEGHQAGLDRALFATAVHYFQKGDHARSIALLEEVVKDFGTTSTASRAMLGLAEVYAAKKDRAKQREWLERCAKFDKTEPTARSIMDTDNTRSDAIQRLALFHEAEGQWKEALAWWKAWQPQSWCGTCRAQMFAQRSQHMAKCLVQLGDPPAAARFLLDQLADSNRDFDASLARPLFQMYRDAGQLGDLRRIVQAREEALIKEYEDKGYFQNQKRADVLRYLPTGPLQDLFRIRELAEKKDITALIAITQDANSVRSATLEDEREWKARVAAEALGECGDAAVQPIRNHLFEGAKNQSWLIYALGNCTVPTARDALVEFAAREQGADTDNIAYALLLHGEAGKKRLEQLRAGDNTTMAATARKWLENPPKQTELPKPKPGSLPRSPDK